MSEWWSYRLSDLLLYSPETWNRLIEQYLRSIWPARMLGALAGVAILLLILRRSDGRVLSAILALAWLWIAWAFHFRTYATINWAAKWFGSIWLTEGLLLFWLGVVRHRLRLGPVPGVTALAGIALLLLGTLGQPLLDRLIRGSWSGAGGFGTMPDPTAVATLGTLLLLHGPRTVLLPIPLVWCLIGGATLLALESPDFWIPPLAAALTLTVAGIGRWSERRAITPSTISE